MTVTSSGRGLQRGVKHFIAAMAGVFDGGRVCGHLIKMRRPLRRIFRHHLRQAFAALSCLIEVEFGEII